MACPRPGQASASFASNSLYMWITAFQNVFKRVDFRIVASDVAQCHYDLRDFTAHRRGFHLCMALAEQETLNDVSYEKRGNVFTRCPLQRNPYVIQFSR